MDKENSVNISNKILLINAAYCIAHKYFTHTSQLPVQIYSRKTKLMGITSTYFHWHKVMAYYSSFLCNIFNASGYSVSKLSFHTRTHTHTHTHTHIAKSHIFLCRISSGILQYVTTHILTECSILKAAL
jgi:hypothetical protein